MGTFTQQNKASFVKCETPKNKASFRSLFRRIHRDEKGQVSIETVLILAAIALPILIFIIKVGWPKIRDFFNDGMEDLREGSVEGQRDQNGY